MLFVFLQKNKYVGVQKTTQSHIYKKTTACYNLSMDFKIIAANNYATASKEIINMLKKTDQTDLSVNHVVISNDRCRMTSEFEMLDALGGSFNTHVLTFARLTTKLMKEKAFISKQSAIMLISRLAEENCDKFLCFTKSYNTPGFASSIYETISQLKYSAISPEQITPSQYDKNLQLKMHDIKILYQAYEDFIHDRYIDSGTKLTHLINVIPQSEFVKNSYFYIKDFDDFSTQEVLIIRQLVIYSKGVVVSLPYVKGRRIYNADNFEHMMDVAKGLKINPQVTWLVDNQPNYVSHLEKNLFDYKTQFDKKQTQDVFVSKESDVFAEAEVVAKHIRQQTMLGARYKDFLVVAGDVAKYAYALERVFAKYQIAYFLDNKVSLGCHALSQFVVGLLRAFKGGFKREDCLAVMKNHFYVTQHDVYAFENLCLKNNWRFFAKPFDAKTDEQVLADQVRSEFVSFVDSFGFKHSDNASAYIQKLKEFVTSEGMATMVDDLCEKAKNTEDSLAKISSQVLDKIVGVLDTLHALFEDKILSDQKFFDLLQTGLDAESISIIPLYNDCVVVTNVAKSRANGNRHLVVMGANDGDFPVVKKDTRIVSDGDIDSLAKSGVYLSPKTESENAKEKFNVFQLLTGPRQSLFITYVANGDQSTPCLAVEEISKMFDLTTDYVDSLKRADLVFGKNQAKEKLIAESSKLADGNLCGLEKASNLFYALEDKQVLDYVPCSFEKQNLVKNKDILLPKGKTSVTKIENFYGCPYRYFLQNGLKIAKRETGELKSVDTGVIIHDVLENFVKAVYVDKRVDEDFCPGAYANSLVDDVLQRGEYQYLTNHPKLAHVLVKIRDEAVSACKAIYDQMQNSSFKPYMAEQSFGFDTKDSWPPVKIVADGHEILLNGKIDRIDVFEDKFVLVDYKTGSASFNDNELFAGKKLQLLTYVMACLQTMQKNCDGFFYMPVNDVFTESGGRFCYIGRVINDKDVICQLDNESVERGMSRLLDKRLTKEGVLAGNVTMGMSVQTLDVYVQYTKIMLQNAIKEMADGFIQQHPYSGNCDFCDYAGVCNYKDLGGQEDNVTGIKPDVIYKVIKNEV